MLTMTRLPEKADRPTMYFVGVTTGSSSIMKVFPVWAKELCIPVMCMQCESPSCMEVCPVGAISRNELGATIINQEKCIGCKMCMNACPLGNIGFNPETKQVHKCDLCGGEPKCAKFYFKGKS